MGQTQGWLLKAPSLDDTRAGDERATSEDYAHFRRLFYAAMYEPGKRTMAKGTIDMAAAGAPPCCRSLLDMLYGNESQFTFGDIANELMQGPKKNCWAWWAFPTSRNDVRSAQGERYQFTSDADALYFVRSRWCAHAMAGILFVILRHAADRPDDGMKWLLGNDHVKLHASCTYLAFVIAVRDETDDLADSARLLLVLFYMLYRLAFRGSWLASTLGQVGDKMTSLQLAQRVRARLGLPAQPTASLVAETDALMASRGTKRHSGLLVDNLKFEGFDIPAILRDWNNDLARIRLGFGNPYGPL